MSADTSLRARMRKLVAEIREIDESLVEPSSRLREDLGMDSLGSLELLSSISEQMDVHVDIEDAMGLVTFEDACSFVERCVAEQRPANVAV